jgi:hypothetical protein
MSIIKWGAAAALLAMGAAVVLGFPGLSPKVEAGLPVAAKSDRLTAPEAVVPQPAQPVLAVPEQASPQLPPPAQALPEPPKVEPAKPTKPSRTKSKQAKSNDVHSKEPEPGSAAKAKGCADTTLSYYEVRCQRTRTRTVNGVRTTRILPD